MSTHVSILSTSFQARDLLRYPHFINSSGKTINNVAVYSRIKANSTDYVQIHQSWVTFRIKMIHEKKDKKIYQDLNTLNSSCIRDFEVIRNKKYRETKKKDDVQGTRRGNIIDEVLDIIGLLNRHPFVHARPTQVSLSISSSRLIVRSTMLN